MIRVLVCLLLVLGLTAEDRVWVGIYVAELGEEGTSEVFYLMGQVGSEDLAAVESGRRNEGFLRLTHVCWEETEPTRVVANASAEGNPEQSDVVLVRLSGVERIVLLKGDPRVVIPAKSTPGAKAPTLEGY